jgi:hypothetical protein
MSTFLHPLPVLTRPLGECRTYRLTGALRHADGDVVPDGYRTDLASVTRPQHWLIPPDGPAEAAAVRHDKRCDDLNRRVPGAYPSRLTDRDFRTDLRTLGMGPIRAWIMWLGVRLGALVSDTRRPGITPDLPLMALLLLLHLWVAVPTLIVTAAVAVLDLLEPGRDPYRAVSAAARHDELTAAAAA